MLNVSAKDILLDVASSSFEKDKIVDPIDATPTNSDAKSIQRLLIIDDLDAIISNNCNIETASPTNTLESEQLSALHAVIKLVDTTIQSLYKTVVVGVARNSLAQLPTQLARVGRFEKEVVMSPPSLSQRKDIFKFWLSTLPAEKNQPKSVISEWADMLAPRTAGCVASDIRRICADALTAAVARESQSLELVSSLKIVLQSASVQWSDVRDAAQSCVPSQLSSMDVIPSKLLYEYNNDTVRIDAKKEFELAWKDFGGYSDMKIRLFRTVVRPWRFCIMESRSTTISDQSPVSNILETSRPSGILFYGPAGNGKTHAAMCLASSLGLNCVKVRTFCFPQPHHCSIYFSALHYFIY